MASGCFQAKDRVFPRVRTYIMGIVNVTPDSFSDGGDYARPEQAVARACEMLREGADILDIGGQSTRPGYAEISPKQEWDRLEPVLRALIKEPGAVISVDSYYPEVAEKALALGVHIINDVSGFGPKMMQAVKGSECGCIVMHPGDEESGGICRRVQAFFETRLREMTAAGIAAERICFDPGIGFGKTQEENLQLIGCTEDVRLPGNAYLLAASRKRVIGAACGNPPFKERLYGTIAAHTAGVMGGADLLRVHDVAAAVQAAQVADAIRSVKDGCH